MTNPNEMSWSDVYSGGNDLACSGCPIMDVYIEEGEDCLQCCEWEYFDMMLSEYEQAIWELGSWMDYLQEKSCIKEQTK